MESFIKKTLAIYKLLCYNDGSDSMILLERGFPRSFVLLMSYY